MPNQPTAHLHKIGREVETLRQLALRMGSLSEAILEKSLRAIWSRDPSLADAVVADDLEIDRIDVEIDQTVLNLLALQAPVASDLRLVLAIKTMATDLERIGDLARNIAGCAKRLADRAPIDAPTDLRNLAVESQRVLSHAIKSFADLDAEKARGVLADDDEIDQAEDEVIREAIKRIHADPSRSDSEIDFIFIAQSLERVGDHATNIAEDVILAAESLNVKHLEKLSS